MKQQLNVAGGERRNTKPPLQTGIGAHVSWYPTAAVLEGRTSPALSEVSQ